jgi:hypothetical protein
LVYNNNKKIKSALGASEMRIRIIEKKKNDDWRNSSALIVAIWLCTLEKYLKK